MKRYLSPLLLAAMVGCSAPVPALAGNLGACWRAPDNDGGKPEHIGISAGFGMVSALAFRDLPWHGQIGLAMVPGVLKEVKDCNSHGLLSRQDLKNDLLGAAVGVGFANFGLQLQASRRAVSVVFAVPLE